RAPLIDPQMHLQLARRRAPALDQFPRETDDYEIIRGNIHLGHPGRGHEDSVARKADGHVPVGTSHQPALVQTPTHADNARRGTRLVVRGHQVPSMWTVRPPTMVRNARP